MAEKVITLNVDLSCGRCRKKMEKILKKYQDEWNIKKVNWNTKDNKITLSGPFNVDELIKKLCCKACKIIKKITTPDPPVSKKPSPPPSPTPTAIPSLPPPSESLTICLTCQICLCGPCHANQKPCNCDCSIARKPCRCNGGYWLNCPPYPQYPPYPPYPQYPPAYGRTTCKFYYEDEPGACVIT